MKTLCGFTQITRHVRDQATCPQAEEDRRHRVHISQHEHFAVYRLCEMKPDNPQETASQSRERA